MPKVSKAQLRLVPEQGNDAHASEVICLINTLDKQGIFCYHCTEAFQTCFQR